MKDFGLIGKRLQHSFSKDYFDAKFKKLKLDDHKFHLFELNSIEQFPNLIKTNTKLRGLSVTIPYKESIIPFLDEVSDAAMKIGAVNSIRFVEREGQQKLVGYNTDYLAFKDTLKPLLLPQDKKAFILGTGGAAKAVAQALLELGIKFNYVSSSDKSVYAYKDLKGKLKGYTVIINTTPVGMYPNVNDILSLPFDEITEEHLLYDLIYNPQETMFIKKGKKRGARTKNGLEMLSLQADFSWEKWTER